ncbi:PCI domain-containing protein 2 isoform X2 [Marmota marmota marmota]|uniref:PCI domain-containing protein 2 isoform X2 n=1 Tax=Marmota marmota marmota TaxID=9994 RepID=UPI0020927978|nr:PCI domain-containing protein 2 isoform X2 [Marmota marmota marmota]
MASPEEKCQQVLEPPYDEMFAAHLRCTYAVGNHDFIEAYKCQTVIVQSFLRAFQAHKEENWALPVMYAVALDLRVFANNADQQLVKKGKSKVGDMLEKAAELLMSCFRVCASDTRAGIEDSKKWGMLFLVNQLFKIYFKINKLHLCKPLIRAIDSSNLRDDYSTAQRVTYKYYVGRKAMFDSDFKQVRAGCALQAEATRAALRLAAAQPSEHRGSLGTGQISQRLRVKALAPQCLLGQKHRRPLQAPWRVFCPPCLLCAQGTLWNCQPLPLTPESPGHSILQATGSQQHSHTMVCGSVLGFCGRAFQFSHILVDGAPLGKGFLGSSLVSVFPVK